MKISLKCWSSHPLGWVLEFFDFIDPSSIQNDLCCCRCCALSFWRILQFPPSLSKLELILLPNQIEKEIKIVMASSSLSTGTPSASAFSKNSSSLVHYCRNGTVFFRLSSSKPKLRFFAKVTNSFCNCFYFFTKNFVNFTEMKLSLEIFFCRL